MNKRKLFGTDGIRGQANFWPITCELATALGRALTHYVKNVKDKAPLIIVGKDTRRSCYMLEQALSAGICSQGGRAILTGPLPTPGVAFVTHSMRANAGVMISASHNSFTDNGIKIFDGQGHKLPDKTELELEHMVFKPDSLPKKIGGELGRAQRLDEVVGRYVVHVKSVFNKDETLEGMRIVLDCAHGAAYRVAPMIFSELGAVVFPLGISPNGENINDHCGPLHPERAQQAVREHGADLGICLDGDADRVILVDHTGEVVTGDQLIGIFARLLLDQGHLRPGDPVVGTVMSNLGLQRALQSLGLTFERTQVGDRYIVEKMRALGSLLGGEPSGHLIYRSYSTTGDGCLGALKIIEAMKFYGESLQSLASRIPLFPQVLKSTLVQNKVPLDDMPSLQKTLKDVEGQLNDRGRVLIRYSGTEPLARVMVEGPDAGHIEALCNRLIKVLLHELR